jgi:hypothetical protein
VKQKCISCGASKAADDFGLQPRRKSGRDPRCKLCIAEQSKFSLREYRMWPRFENELSTWPLVKVESEIRWLAKKLNRLKKERAEREQVTP